MRKHVCPCFGDNLVNKSSGAQQSWRIKVGSALCLLFRHPQTQKQTTTGCGGLRRIELPMTHF